MIVLFYGWVWQWTCPPIDIPPIEVDIWNELKNDAIATPAAIKRLTDARDGMTISSPSLILAAFLICYVVV